jgi:hypothetical protein
VLVDGPVDKGQSALGPVGSPRALVVDAHPERDRVPDEMA